MNAVHRVHISLLDPLSRDPWRVLQNPQVSNANPGELFQTMKWGWPYILPSQPEWQTSVQSLPFTFTAVFRNLVRPKRALRQPTQGRYPKSDAI